MAQIVNIQPLRVHGIRVTDLPDVVGGYFKVSHEGSHVALAVVGTQTGRLLLGPILDPMVVAAEPEGFVLQGTECSEGCNQPQEWLVVLAKRSPELPDLPLW